MTEMEHLARLQRPSGVVDVVLDTDAYNEIDDQYAIAWLLLSPHRANVQAIYAAPYAYSNTPEEGMENSYQEILHLLDLMKRQDVADRVYRGSKTYLPDERTPVESPAARDLVRLALAHTPENPLYVLAIGCLPNVASAILMCPECAKNMVVVWLGGTALHWPHSYEFNLYQDVAAARVVFDSDAALVLVPCAGVVDHLVTTGPELDAWLRGRNDLCSYLVAHTFREAESYAAGKPWSRVIWDVVPVAWLLDDKGEHVRDQLTPTPIPQYDHHWSSDSRRKLCRCVYDLDRDAIFEDLFACLANAVRE